ncbi:MAG: cytochrome b/b6 domain-containing protein [Gammaproteobacteria bacterium]|nr:cytochrome b/b6 domain-containing protein [Gammaproteobacteria bacterium]
MAAHILRHALIDRIFHWLTAACVLVLMATAFLPILGIKFSWVTIHWATGVVLGIAVLIHVVRALVFQRATAIWVSPRDLGEGLSNLKAALSPAGRAIKPGKYSLAQKSMHLLVTILILAVLVTGGLMMVRVDTPFWERNPYWLTEAQWGTVYVLHGLAALTLVTTIMLHIYFALRPEKLCYTRSMIKGWLTESEREKNHDIQRW